MKKNIWKETDKQTRLGEKTEGTEMQESQMLSLCPPSRPVIPGGGNTGAGRAEPEGQRRVVHLGVLPSPKAPPEGSRHPHPFPI